MKFTNRISAAQQRFIRAVRDGRMTPADLAAKQRANPKQFSRWFRNKYFWHNVKWAAREVMRRSWLGSKLAVAAADEMLAQGIASKAGLPIDLLLTCDKVKEHARADDRLELSRRRARPRKKRSVDPERDLVHPDFKHREAELLAVLEGNREGSEC